MSDHQVPNTSRSPMTVSEFLALPPRYMDGYFAEHAMGYTRTTAPPDGAGENGGTDLLLPPGGYPSPYSLPPKGAVHFAFFAPQLATDRHPEPTVNYMYSYGFDCTIILDAGCRVTFTHRTDGRCGSYFIPNRQKAVLCAMVAAGLALGILVKDGESR